LRSVVIAAAFLRAWVAARLLVQRFQEPVGLRRAIHRVIPHLATAHAPASRQLLIDVSVLARHDAGTGVQRATKELLRELTAAPPERYVVRTVRATRWRSYRYTDGAVSSSRVQINSGDIFLGLDLASRILPRHALQLFEWQMRRAKICVVMHDLLPLLQPAWFTRRNARAYRAWICAVAVHADSVICVSRFVAEQFNAWLSDHGFDRERAPDVGWFHHGARLPSDPRRRMVNVRVAQIAQRPFVLMVGTIEPRKGYAMVLDAFEALWQSGLSIQLVIVGRVGWKVSSLVTRLRGHLEAGRRLHWFHDADDDTLHALYEAAAGVTIASEAEGFGLPILEAALRRKPLLIRDLPVFREIAGHGATYFGGETLSQFAGELRSWLNSLAAGTAIQSGSIPVQSWAQSARQLIHQAIPLDRPF
jgi:glycosyltransferase involved in cell wall biosynthesis